MPVLDNDIVNTVGVEKSFYSRETVNDWNPNCTYLCFYVRDVIKKKERETFLTVFNSAARPGSGLSVVVVSATSNTWCNDGVTSPACREQRSKGRAQAVARSLPVVGARWAALRPAGGPAVPSRAAWRAPGRRDAEVGRQSRQGGERLARVSAGDKSAFGSG